MAVLALPGQLYYTIFAVEGQRTVGQFFAPEWWVLTIGGRLADLLSSATIAVGKG